MIEADNVTWKWYHNNENPLIGEFVDGNTIRVLELDKDFTLGEALDLIGDFNLEANGGEDEQLPF